MSVGKIGQRRQVVIPKAVCEEAGLEEGDFVEIVHRRGLVVIKPKKMVDRHDTLTPEEEKLVAKGFAQLKRGEYENWEDLKRELDL